MIKFVTLNYEIYNSFMEGRVKWFDDKRGYGFITSDDGEDGDDFNIDDDYGWDDE